RLEVMRYAGHGKDVLQLRRQRRIGIGRVAVVLLRLLDRLRPEERGIVGVLAMDQRYETEVGELLLATIGDRHFCRALECDLAIVGPERMGRELLDQATALDPPDRRAPAEVLERTGQPGAERICGVAPKVAGVVGAIDLLDEIEALHRRSLLRSVRKA